MRLPLICTRSSTHDTACGQRARAAPYELPMGRGQRTPNRENGPERFHVSALASAGVRDLVLRLLRELVYSMDWRVTISSLI
jgi:hypothetical protein